MVEITRLGVVASLGRIARQSPPRAGVAVHPPRGIARIRVVGHRHSVTVVVARHVGVQSVDDPVAVHVLVRVGHIGTVGEVHRMRVQNGVGGSVELSGLLAPTLQRVVVEDCASRADPGRHSDGGVACAQIDVGRGVAVLAGAPTGRNYRTARAIAPLTVRVDPPAVHRAVVENRAHVVGGAVDSNGGPAYAEVDVHGAVGHSPEHRGDRV